MKAKEEYVDAPRETRSKDITVYAIIFLVLLVGAGIFLAFRLLQSLQMRRLQTANPGSFMIRPQLKAAGIISVPKKLRRS